MFYLQHFKGLFLLFTSCSLFLFSSCQSGVDGTAAPEEGQGTVTFSVTNYRQISFDDLSSSAATRATSSDAPSTLDHLLVAVFDAETGQQACSPIQHDYDNYKSKPETYGQFSIVLPYGHYRVLALGYNGRRKCNVASLNHISWDDDFVPNTFLYCKEFTLDKDSNLDSEITLRHVVSAFRVTAEDAIPSELKKMRFSSTSGGTVLNALTGFTAQNTGRTWEIEVPTNYAGAQGVDFTVYLFLPANEINTSYTVQALGQNNSLLYEKLFNDVPLHINVLTMWQGNFFEESAEEGISLYWDTQWADTITIDH